MAFLYFSFLVVGILSKPFLLDAQLNDQATLLAIKKELGSVSGWGDNTTDYCNWEGIHCGLNHSFVERLDLSRRMLKGNVTLISNLKALKHLDLSYNNFNGPIPSAFGNLSELEYLDLSWKREIHQEFKVLGKLEDIQVSSNRLSGSIPHWVGQLTNLKVFTAYENHLGGEIPDNLGLVSELKLLNLHSNRLDGPIPKSVFALGKLEILVLTQNGLTGYLPEAIVLALGTEFDRREIPRDIGNCVKLLELQLGSNYLTGSIPPEIGHIRNLQIALNLSFNHLHGELPSELGKLDKLVSLDVSSNQLSALWGAIEFLMCRLYWFRPANYHHRVSYRIILAVIGSGLAVFISVTVVVLLFMMRERQEKALKSVDAIDEATSSRPTVIAGNVFVENLRQRHAFGIGSVGEETEMMDRTIIHHQNKMIRELERLSKLYHDNLLNFFTSPQSCQYQPDWPRRLSIAVGVAEGLAFLHHVAVIHLDISSEYAYTMQVTAPGNVYSYGVVLLEILTSRLPVDEDFGEGVDLVKWVHGAPARGETPEQILDAKLSTVSFGWRREMLAALKVALLCTDSTPAKRPKMKKVVEMLQEIRQTDQQSNIFAP
ncbi:Leucine-rich repeat receptor-like tyrosine-protein kinase PXC3 [Hibiscus syriacus]|uniref:Leucine-rich repeat receptor-like tyrosine-protein kinase PXC3 n=1 Tax=Hibiscus syriacus TaxID=106335 RepID=A0A6A2XS25_HIBSY|nr:Leucine-rich repeat receptor-like tyrosine-protein kinase PXC3 [Hibiscus syriacus]